MILSIVSIITIIKIVEFKFYKNEYYGYILLFIKYSLMFYYKLTPK